MTTPIDLMRHALGVQSVNGRFKKPYRNHFVAGGDNVAAWDALVSAGLAQKVGALSRILSGGDPTYVVTDAGRAHALAGITFKTRWGYETKSEVAVTKKRETKAEREERKEQELRTRREIAAHPETRQLFEVARAEPSCSKLEVTPHGITIRLSALPVRVAREVVDLVVQRRAMDLLRERQAAALGS